MDSLDGLLLARIQFAANITFHILFPTISIALGWALLSMRLAWLRLLPSPPPPWWWLTVTVAVGLWKAACAVSPVWKFVPVPLRSPVGW